MAPDTQSTPSRNALLWAILSLWFVYSIGTLCWLELKTSPFASMCVTPNR